MNSMLEPAVQHLLEPDVTSEHPTVPSARPLSDLRGKRVAFVDNSKVNADFFLSRVSQMLVDRFGIIAGPTIRKAAPKDSLAERDLSAIAACAAAVQCFGDCGTSTSMSVADPVDIERRGIPAVTVFSTAFAHAARIQAAGRGMPDLRLVKIPHPMHTASRATVTERADNVIDALAERLTQPASAGIEPAMRRAGALAG